MRLRVTIEPCDQGFTVSIPDLTIKSYLGGTEEEVLEKFRRELISAADAFVERCRREVHPFGSDKYREAFQEHLAKGSDKVRGPNSREIEVDFRTCQTRNCT